MQTEHSHLFNLGFALLLLRPNSKAPLERDWTKGPRTSLETLRHSYSQSMNVGVRLGVPSVFPDNTYLAAIDCDVKSSDPAHLKEMEAKLRELIGVDAPTVLSGRGGGSRHLYIRTVGPTVPRRFSQSKDRVKVLMPSVPPTKSEKASLTKDELDEGFRLRPAWEISVMGTGQQCVLPPSIHPDSGKRYEWKRGHFPSTHMDFPIVDLSEFYGTNDDDDSTKMELVEDFEVVPFDLVGSPLRDDIVDKIVSGKGVEDRSAALLSVTMSMVSIGLDDNEILSILTDPANFLGSAAYDHAKTTSRKRAAGWLAKYTLKKARYALSAQRDFEGEVEVEEPLSEAQALEQARELMGEEVHWRAMLDRVQTTNRVKPTLHNAFLIIKHAPERPYLAFDVFSHKVLITDTPQWDSGLDKVPRELKDIDLVKARKWLAFHYGVEPAVGVILEAILNIAHEASFHPVKDYLESLVWDGTPRLKTWLAQYLGAMGPAPYLSEVSEIFIMAMIKRIYEPGCKMDYVPILEGLQGEGKSSALRILGGEWFTDARLDIGDKDSILKMQGKWLCELGELSTLSRSEIDAIKEFITQEEDRIRSPYGRVVETFPRQMIFVGTTNRDEYLKDHTGNRRYFPFLCSAIDLPGLKAVRDQLFAEALAQYNLLGARLYLTKGTEAIAAEVQEERLEYDHWIEIIGEALKLDDFQKPFTMRDLVDHPSVALNVRNKSEQMRVVNLLRKMGCQDRRVKGVRYYTPPGEISLLFGLSKATR